MSKIGNKELARVLADKHGLDRQAAEQFVARLFDVLNEGLRDDKQVKVKGLGTFKVTSVASRKSVDVNTGEPIVIEGRDKITFTADASMRDQVNRPFAQFETVVVNDGVDFDEIDRRFADSMDGVEASDESDDDQPEGAEAVAAASEVGEPVEAVVDAAPAGALAQPETIAENMVEASAAQPATAVEQPLRIAADQLALLNGDVRSQSAAVVEEAVAEPEHTSPDVPTDAAIASDKPKDEALSLSPMQLAVLNGQRPPIVEEVEMSVAEENTVAVEKETAVEGSETTALPQDEEVGEIVDTPQSAALADVPTSGEQAATLDAAPTVAQELMDRVDRQQRRLHALMVVASLLLLMCVGGIFYLASQLDKRNHRIEHLEAEAQTARPAPQEHKAVATPVPDEALAQARADSLKALEEAAEAEQRRVAAEQQRAEAARLAAQKAEEQARQKAEADRQAAQARAAAAAKRQAEERKAAEAQRVAEAKKLAEQKAKAAPSSKYDSDPRVRTGAYAIEGIDHTVTVRSGQTLASISKANLGPGMECYVEAVNGGRKELKAGDKVNIPKLKLKKK